MKKVIDKRFAKGKKTYTKVLETIESIGECPFCPHNFKYHKKPILNKHTGWFITENNWPYKNTEKHFLIISEKHKEHFSELTLTDFSAVRYLVNWATKKFNIKGGAIALRFGDTSSTGATVCHLHFHFIYPKQDKKNLSKTVLFPIG